MRTFSIIHSAVLLGLLSFLRFVSTQDDDLDDPDIGFSVTAYDTRDCKASTTTTDPQVGEEEGIMIDCFDFNKHQMKINSVFQTYNLSSYAESFPKILLSFESSQEIDSVCVYAFHKPAGSMELKEAVAAYSVNKAMENIDQPTCVTVKKGDEKFFKTEEEKHSFTCLVGPCVVEGKNKI